ncbi:hypothetical protein AB0D47_37155 [Streptomyces sp. NPDC048376]|jgi:hypothetical protein|uniref:hypothetical protein n=1 Tax=unclassified Streptomyces TaxID=2593676 RepID=UPI0029B65D96|nr:MULTISPECIES: hypothetical protein [unclassified Streptomyces]MDX3366094.1 hypothetical protein [Streptomyces sp. ME02-6987-2C]MDX3426401.1 hypothetical protein [Streptomyces sp. ME02-6985-2c]
MSLVSGSIPEEVIDPDDFAPAGEFDPTRHGGTELLGYLSWAVTAAAVAGLLIVGIQMAMQLRRGEMGEGATYYRGVVFVLGACIIGATAGPIVQFVIVPWLAK